ncbi:MAG: hypothetical protein P1V20_28685 [Verrucomicrobiales bacterium]|nr:hypothetical protein [Verrucomicrobiales bacterium]
MNQVSSKPDTANPTFDQLASQETPSRTTQPAELPSHETELNHYPDEAVIYRSGKDLVLANGAVLPDNACIKTGKAPQRVLAVSLRNPLKPSTWFTHTPKTMVGLSKAALETYRITQAISFSLTGLGLVMIPVGVFSGFTTAAFGLLLCLAGLVIRAMFPVWSVSQSEEIKTIKGCGEEYRKHFAEGGEAP